ncbi:MAG TPA: 50S ribosomal protein L2 [Bacteroidota bacterium]|nr:50S ribosomal protein L2 [Bacteroidota bacterium]
MALRKLKPTTAATRFYTISTFEEITKTTPEKSLLAPIKKSGGRNSYGRVTSRHRGGGHKRKYRIIDFKRDKRDIPAKVAAIEYDPNRSTRIALLVYADGEKRYILAPEGLKLKDTLVAGNEVEIKTGNAMPLRVIPVNTQIHNIEIREGKGGQVARSAGNFATVQAKEGDFVLLKFPSGEVRNVRAGCYATVGMLGNIDHENISVGKAGRSRWLGIRSHVRGVAMNPVDHPMGGGEGKTSGGGHPVSPWGQKSKGLKTRKRKKISSKYIVKRRK